MNITLTSDIVETPRVIQIRGMFDIQPQKTETTTTQRIIEKEEIEKEEKAKTKKTEQLNTTGETAQEEEIPVGEPWKESTNYGC